MGGDDFLLSLDCCCCCCSRVGGGRELSCDWQIGILQVRRGFLPLCVRVEYSLWCVTNPSTSFTHLPHERTHVLRSLVSTCFVPRSRKKVSAQSQPLNHCHLRSVQSNEKRQIVLCLLIRFSQVKHHKVQTILINSFFRFTEFSIVGECCLAWPLPFSCAFPGTLPRATTVVFPFHSTSLFDSISPSFLPHLYTHTHSTWKEGSIFFSFGDARPSVAITWCRSINFLLYNFTCQVNSYLLYSSQLRSVDMVLVTWLFIGFVFRVYMTRSILTRRSWSNHQRKSS